MIKLNEAASTLNTSECKKDEKHANEEPKEGNVAFNSPSTSSNASDKSASKPYDTKKDVSRFSMIFNKFNSDTSKNSGNEDKQKREVQCVMFFNKDVTIRSSFKSKKNSNPFMKINRNQSKLSSHKLELELGKPQISEPMFSHPFTPPTSISSGKAKTENVQKSISKKNSKTETDSLVQLNVHPAMRTDLRTISSLTSLNKNPKVGIRNNLKSKIPSLTSIETKSISHKNDFLRNSDRHDWDEQMLMQNDVEKRLNLQISRSSNDHNHRFTTTTRFKKEDGASVSDSKLLYADFESKKQIKKCDKKSRGDSSRKERESGSRKQVQWKTEVDVIYFSTHLAANGDRMREVIGRVMEPLREEWEQQRNGFYSKMVPYQMESHLKDRFISLLKI